LRAWRRVRRRVRINLAWTYSDPIAGALDRLSLGAVEVWSSATNDRSAASKVAEGIVAAVHTGLLRAAVRYYWIIPRDKSGNYGDWYPASLTGGIAGTEVIGTLTVPSVGSLVASGGLGLISLSWVLSDPNANGLGELALDVVEVHAAATDDRTLATKVAEGKTAAIHNGLARGAQRFYWARPRHVNGTFGAWYPAATPGGVSGTELVGSLTVPAVGGLVASGGVGLNSLTWTLSDPNSNGLGGLALDVVEAHAAATDDRTLATKVAEGKTFTIHNGLARGAQRFYWLRPRHINGTFGAWYPVATPGGVAATELSGDVNLNVPGYWKHPSGLIIQWGNSAASNASGFAAATFPIAFPNNLFYVAGQVGNNNALVVPVANLYTDNLTSATWLCTMVDQITPFSSTHIAEEIMVGVTVNYIAFGY
jgi:hypothetical protein